MKWNLKIKNIVNLIIDNSSEGIAVFCNDNNNIIYNHKVLEIFKLLDKDEKEIKEVLLPRFQNIVNNFDFDTQDNLICYDNISSKANDNNIKLSVIHSIFKNIFIIGVSGINPCKEPIEPLPYLCFLHRRNDILATVINANSVIEFVNPLLLHTFNIKEREVLGSDILTLGQKLTEFAGIRIWKTISEGFVWEGEIKTIRKDGEDLFLKVRIIPLKNKDTIEKFLIIAKDISQKKIVEHNLLNIEKKKNIILNALPDTILVFDSKGVIMDFKCEAEQDLFPTKNIINKNITEIGLPLEFVNKLINARRFAIKTQKIKQFLYKQNEVEKYAECRVIALNEEEVICLIRDISKKVIAEKLIKNREKSYKSMVENFPSGILIQKNNRFFYANKIALAYLGCKTLKEIIKYNIYDLIPEEYVDTAKERIQKVYNGENASFMEFPVRNLKNNQFSLYETKPVLFEYYGETVCQIVIRDLSVQKKLIKETLRAEMAEKMNAELQNQVTKRKFTEQSLLSSVKEKEELIKEIHHRVKNNMQVMLSILNLQSNMISNPQMKQIFDESQNRIKSMALVHENIYSNKSLTKIDFNQYLTSLVDSLFRSYSANDKNIEIKYIVGNFYLPVTLAVPCGLIINEIISYSIKRFFVEISNSFIIFVEAKLINNEVQIKISDSGALIKEKNLFKNPSILGFQLIQALIEQLNGKISLSTKPKNKISVFFNI